MDGNSWRPPTQGESNGMDTNGWRAQLSSDARARIVNKMVETLKKHLPMTGPEGLGEHQKIAVRFEEKIYTAATSHSDYLRRISMKMLTMESKSQPGSTTTLQSNPAGGNQNPADPAMHGMQLPVHNQGQSLPLSLAGQSQQRQQLLSQNLQNTTMQSSGLPPALSSITGLTQAAIPNVVGQSSSLPTMSGISQNSVSNSVGQGVQSNLFANSQRQMQGRPQRVVPQQHQQQLQNPQQMLYQQQYLKPKMQNIPANVLQSQMQQQQQQQQQQQPLLQPNQMQPSQQPLVQSVLSSSQPPRQQTQTSMMQSTQQPSLQQNQQSSIQQSAPSVLQQQSVLRQQQQTAITQQSMLPSQQQQQLTGQQPSAANIQQNQLLGQQSNIQDIPQQLQQRLLGQQNGLSAMQQQQQPLLAQQNSMPTLHQQQLGPQSNVSGLQQHSQLLGPGVLIVQQHPHSMQILQHSKVSGQQQQAQQASSTLLPSQAQQSQSQPPQQQLMSQLQSQPAQLQQQLQLQQQPNSLQREMQQSLQTPGALLQTHNTIEQQKQLFQSQQRGLPEGPSSSMDSTAQTGSGQTGVVDLQEEIYQKIKSMKEQYLPELNELYRKIHLKCQEVLHEQPKSSEPIEKLKNYKGLLERVITFLQLPKNNISITFKEKLPHYQRQIQSILISNNRTKKNGVPQQQVMQQQLQQPCGQSNSMMQQPQSQTPQMQQHDGHVNQLQPMNLQASMSSMQPNAATGMQHGSMPLSAHLGVPTSQPSMLNALQPNSNLDSTSGNGMNGVIGSLQQTFMGLQQNPVNTVQQANVNMLSQSGANALQPNINPLQPSSNMLQHQHLKQEQSMQTQQFNHQYQQRQQMIMQQQRQKQQQQQLLQLLLQQQQKPQQSMQLQPHQMQQLHQMNEGSEMKVRPGMGLKTAIFPQHHPSGPHPTYHHHQQQQQLKMQAPFSMPSSLQSQSPQISQHSSPQIDQQSLLTSIPKSGTPLQSASSPFIAPPSPSTPTPVAPSPLPGDPEKQQASGISPISMRACVCAVCVCAVCVCVWARALL